MISNILNSKAKRYKGLSTHAGVGGVGVKQVSEAKYIKGDIIFLNHIL